MKLRGLLLIRRSEAYGPKLSSFGPLRKTGLLAAEFGVAG